MSNMMERGSVKCHCPNKQHGAFGCSIDIFEATNKYEIIACKWCKVGCIKRAGL